MSKDGIQKVENVGGETMLVRQGTETRKTKKMPNEI